MRDRGQAAASPIRLKLTPAAVHTGSGGLQPREEICLFSEELDAQIHRQHVVKHLGKKNSINTKMKRVWFDKWFMRGE